MNEVNQILTDTEKLQNACREKYQAVKHQPLTFYSPMVVSKLLTLLKDLRLSLEKIQSLQMKYQEESAWLTLNACKLIYDIAQPLLWFNCGKYVIESLTYAAISMEAVINLCTVRHMHFRMKLYASIFYSVLVQGSTDEAQAIWDHCQKQITELKERELLDPPLPQASMECLTSCYEDLLVLKYCLDVWRDNDSIDFTLKGTDKYSAQVNELTADIDKSYKLDTEHFRFRILNEVLRVHHLCSGNMNETFMKRATHILKAMESTIQTIDLEKLDERVVCSIYEMGSLSILDSGETSTFHSQIKSLVSQLPETDPVEGNFKDRLQFLVQTQDLLLLPHDDPHYLEILSRFSAELNRMIFVDSSYYSRSFYGKFSAAVVRRILYEPLQKLLSSLQPVSFKLLTDLSSGLTLVIKSLESVFAQDSIFFGTLVTLNVNVLSAIDDLRGAISVARRGIMILEDHRAARVDFHAMLPEDTRDIMALQRQSFTTRSDSADWYHAVKRLGAHAFAGFGIFGLGSSTDRGDQALAETHAELLSLYFRCELRYGINHFLLRKSLLLKNKELELAKAAALKENPNLKKKPQDKEKTKKPATASNLLGAPSNDTLAVLNSSIDLSSNSSAVSISELPIFNTLKIFCAKNPYAQSILMMEAARMDANPNQRQAFLEKAFSAIEEAEEQETKLLEHFNSYTLFSHQDRCHPIVVSRTHRYIYVAPVGCRKLKNVAYYKVHAKEKGSGTDVSIYNTDLTGSEKRISIVSISNFRDSVVRIGPLRNGELYMFGSVGYGANDAIVGGVSPSTMAVHAVNPLPTVLLWSLLGQAANQLQENRICINASWRVCCHYFQSMPKREAFSVSSGKNLFQNDEPVICSLAVQQSTPVMLHHFIMSLIRYESLHYREENFGIQDKWNYRKSEQLRYLISFERLGAVAFIASSLQNQDVVMQLLLMSEILLDELLRYDIAHLARKVEPVLSNLLLCLQRLPKRHWHEAEHRLYYKFCTALVQLGMISKNLTPVVSILNEFFVDSRSKRISPLVYPSETVLKELEGLIRYADNVLGDSAKSLLLSDAKTLLSSEKYQQKTDESENVSEFWRIPPVQRYLKLAKKAKDLATPPAALSIDQQEIEKALTQEHPLLFSDYLSVILCIMQELHHQGDYGGPKKILEKYPICQDYVAAEIRESHDLWEMGLLISMEHFVERKSAAQQPAAAPAGKKAPPPKKGAAPEPEAVPAMDWSKVPTRFASPSPEERRLQSSRIAEIALILTAANEKTRGSVNYFVKSHRGLLKRVVPNQEFIKNETRSPLELSKEQSNTEIAFDHIIRHLGWSIALLTRSDMPNAACNIILRLWNVLVAEYVDPNQFAVSFPSLKGVMNLLLGSLTELIEKIGLVSQSLSNSTVNGNVEIDPLALLESPPEPSTYQKRDIVTLFRAVIRPLNYIVKVHWLYHEHPEDIVLKCSQIFQVFVNHDPTECLKSFCEEIWELVTEAQQTLINQATNALSEAKQSLEKYIFDFEEMQRKKRKKKLRIARTEKDEEELLFEAEKTKFEVAVTQAQTKLEECEVEMAEVQNKLSYFHESLTKGDQMAQVAKNKLFSFISYLGHRYGSSLDWRRILSTSSDEVALSMFAELRKSFEKVARYLREKKQRLLLVDILEDYTNVLIRFGLFVDVEQFLNDVVDGLFNAMDATLNWKSVMESAFQPDFDLSLVPGLPYVMSALGKLSKYCAVNDYNRKGSYARMSSEIAMLLFQESIGHPVTKLGMAAYECVDLGGCNSVSPYLHQSWFQAMEESISVLFSECAFLDILPLTVLGEYLAALHLRNMRLWLKIRIHRIRALIRQHLFSEAIAMYTGIRPTIEKMSVHLFGDVLRQTKAVDTANTTAYDASANDLNYFGKASVFFNNLLPGDEQYNAKALEWMTSAPSELEAFLSSFTVAVPESDLSPEQRQQIEEEKKAKAEAEAAAATSKKGAKAPAKGASAAAEEQQTNASFPRLPVFPQTQIVQMYLLSGQLLTEISTIDTHQVPKHALIAEKWAGRAFSIVQKAKEYLFSRFTETTREEDVQDFFLRTLQQPSTIEDLHGDSESKSVAVSSSPRSHANSDLYAHFMLRLMRADNDWLSCYVETFLTEQALFVYRRKYREILTAATRLCKLFAHPIFHQLSSGDLQFQLMQFWFQCQWYQVQALEGQANRKAIVACISDAMLPCCAATHAGHWERTFLYHRAGALRILGNWSQASKDMDSVISGFAQQQDLESVALSKALVLRASLLQQEIQRLHGGDNKTCLEIYHKHQKTLELLRRAAAIGHRLGLQAGMFSPDTNITFQLTGLDYQLPESETSKNETFSGAVSGYHLLHPSLHAFTDIHDNAPPLSITSSEAATNTDKSFTLPWQRLRLGPIDGLTTLSLGPEEGAFLGVHPANVYCNIYLRESRVLLQAQMALLQLLDDVRNKDIQRLRHVMRSSKAKHQAFSKVDESATDNNNDDDDEDTGPFDSKVLQLEEVYLVEYILKLLRQVVYVSPSVRSRCYYYAARARMSSANPQGYSDLRAFVPLPTASGALSSTLSPAAGTPAIPPIMMQVQLTPIVTAIKVLTHAKATQSWSLLKRLCLEVVRYFGQVSVTSAVEEHGVGTTSDVLRQAAQYLLLAAQVSLQRSKLRQGVSELVESGAELNAALTNDLLLQWTTQCFTSSMAPAVPSPAEMAASHAVAAAAAAAAPTKGGKTPATGKGAPAAASAAVTTSPTGRDAVALLVSTLREQAEFDDVRVDANDTERWVEDAPAISLSHDLHVLLQQTFPSSYAATCALTSAQLPPGELLPLVAAQVAFAGSTATGATTPVPPVTQAIGAGSVSAVWDSLVSTPADWVTMHSDVVTGKWFTQDVRYGLYSHAAMYVLLGDPVVAPNAASAAPVVPAPTKGKAAAGNAAGVANAGSAPAAASDSKDPVLTRIVLYKGDIDICERRLRQLAFDLQNQRDPSAVTGDAESQSVGCKFFAVPSPSYFASLVWAIVLLLKHGHVGGEYWSQLASQYDRVDSLHQRVPEVHAGDWDAGNMTFIPSAPGDALTPAATSTQAAPASPRLQSLQQLQVPQKPAAPPTGQVVLTRHVSNLTGVSPEQPMIISMPYNAQVAKQLADLLNRTRDQALVFQPEICNFIRLCLGYSTPAVSARTK